MEKCSWAPRIQGEKGTQSVIECAGMSDNSMSDVNHQALKAFIPTKRRMRIYGNQIRPDQF